MRSWQEKIHKSLHAQARELPKRKVLWNFPHNPSVSKEDVERCLEEIRNASDEDLARCGLRRAEDGTLENCPCRTVHES